MIDDERSGFALSRRRVLGLTVAAGVVTACGGGPESDGGDSGMSSDAEQSTPRDDTPAPGPADGLSLAKTSDVPVAGGVIIREAKVVVTQPTSGEFKGFSAICTHQGCVVSSVEGQTINCECHGSAFKISDGSVVSGPARSALREVDVKLVGDSIVKA